MSPSPPRPPVPGAAGGSRSPRRRGGGDGEPSVFVADEQETEPVDAVRWEALARAVLDAEGVTGAVEVALLFVTADTIAELKRTYLDSEAEGPTDVLSFPIDAVTFDSGRNPDVAGPGPRRRPDLDAAPLLLGDVVICPTVARAQAPTHAGTYEDELALLIVHGLLHLLGRDHAVEAERAAMQSRERELLVSLHGEPARDPWQD